MVQSQHEHTAPVPPQCTDPSAYVNSIQKVTRVPVEPCLQAGPGHPCCALEVPSGLSWSVHKAMCRSILCGRDSVRGFVP